MSNSMRARPIAALILAGALIAAAPAAGSIPDPVGGVQQAAPRQERGEATAEQERGEATAEQERGEIVLRRDGSRAVPFVAHREGIVLRRDGSRAEPFVAQLRRGTSAADGFDWGDAAIGAGTGIAAALFVAAGSSAARRRRGQRLERTSAAQHGA